MECENVEQKVTIRRDLVVCVCRQFYEHYDTRGYGKIPKRILRLYLYKLLYKSIPRHAINRHFIGLPVDSSGRVLLKDFMKVFLDVDINESPYTFRIFRRLVQVVHVFENESVSEYVELEVNIRNKLQELERLFS